MKNNIMKDNKGFSLLELVVAVLILGIISAVAITSFRTVFNARSEAAAEVAASVLKQTRSKTMALVNDASSETYARFYLSGSDYYVDLVRKVTTAPADPSDSATTKVDVLVSKKLGNDGLTLSFRNHNSIAVKETVTATNDVKIYFTRATGGLKEIIGSSTYDFSDPTDPFTVLDELYIEGSGDDRTIIMVPATGRCFNKE